MNANIIPTMRYRDAPAMIDWLCEVLGFERHMVFEGGEGGIAHAQLSLGPGMIMLGSARDDEFGRLQSTPEQLGGTTQSPYVVVPNPDEVWERAKAAGAPIVRPPHDTDYGSREFSFRDPGGHLWNVGTYDPWATPGPT